VFGRIRPRRPDGKIESLQGLPLLAGLSHAQLVRLAALAELVDVPAGTGLIREGDPAREAFLVIEGHLRVERAGQIVARLGAGDLAGEVSLIDRGSRATSVVAETSTRVAVVTRTALQELVRTSPWFTEHLLSQLALRVRAGQAT
jgi:CRP/FNR family transcriptional regulator, cyclic AMP receptor protein